MTNKITRETALITGASSGIGKHLALECARRSINLLLVALPETGLEIVAHSILRRYNVTVHIVEIDLAQPGAAVTLYDFCKKNNIKVNILINNAGIGYEDAFGNLSVSFCEKLIQLNTQAVVSLTRIFLDELKLIPNSYILNVSSMASFTPMPFKCIYAASKSFIYNFSRSLQSELTKSSVHVCVLCPGPVPSNSTQVKRIATHGWMGKLAAISPSEVAAQAITKMLNKENVIVPGILNNINRLLMNVLPENFKLQLLTKAYQKSRN